MDKFFIAIYRFFEKKKALMYGLLILSSVIFVYFGSKVQYEENIAKLLPQTDVATESGLAFSAKRWFTRQLWIPEGQDQGRHEPHWSCTATVGRAGPVCPCLGPVF